MGEAYRALMSNSQVKPSDLPKEFVIADQKAKGEPWGSLKCEARGQTIQVLTTKIFKIQNTPQIYIIVSDGDSV